MDFLSLKVMSARDIKVLMYRDISSLKHTWIFCTLVIMWRSFGFLAVNFFFFFNYLTLSVPNEGTECHSRIVSTLLTLPEHLSSPPVFSGVRVTRSLVWCVCFVDRCLFFSTFSIGHCIVCSSLIYGFWLPLLYLQTLLDMHVFIATRIM